MDETRVRHINVKVQGFVERIWVDYVGKTVRTGDPLFAIYSPELLSAQEELLLALRTRRALSRAAALGDDGDALVEAARKKLSLWDVPESQIDRIAASGEAHQDAHLLLAGFGRRDQEGVVRGHEARGGGDALRESSISPGLGARRRLRERAAAREAGDARDADLERASQPEFKGKVLFIDPMLDPKTRTVKVRVWPSPTRAASCSPEMFGEVVLHGEAHEGLRIPPDAVIDSGTEKVVFVARATGSSSPG